jgi:5-(carboxyamino)imidazole ribonucleotide mutase
MTATAPLVAVLMGSTSDWETMQHCSAQLAALGVPHECKAISAHRQPATLHAYVEKAEAQGVQVFIGAAGGAAHLPGVLASLTAKPVLGVPMKGWATEGLDALLSIAQMPGGVPVGTLAIGKAGAKNAAILAAQILGLSRPAIDQAVRAMRAEQSQGAKDLPPEESPRA